MKLLQAVIYGFGKFYQKTISFQDGIHVIYGPNEAGKSTLHTFLGCMLFGLERGRGRAAKGDLYSRCLPWDHDATYGGSLSLEKDDTLYQIQRSFRSENRSCQLSEEGMPPVPCTEQQAAEALCEGLNEALYYNTISVRQLGCAPDSSLAEELQRQLTGLHQSGSDTIQYTSAVSWLKSQRKVQEALLDPDLEKKTLQTRQQLSRLKQRLDSASFQEQKAALEMDMDHCMEQLAALTPESPPRKSRHRVFGEPSENTDLAPRSFRSRHSIVFFLVGLCFLVLAVILRQSLPMPAAIAVGGIGLLFLLLSLLRSGQRKKAGYDDETISQDGDTSDDSDGFDDFHDCNGLDDFDRLDDLDELDDLDRLDDLDELNVSNDTKALRLRRQMQSLQKRYESICRREWEQDQLLEQAQALEEELELLAVQAAEEDRIRLEIQAITLALTTLQNVSGQLQDAIGPQLGQTMSSILDGLTGGAYSRVCLDGQLTVTLQSGSRTVPLESLSRGTIEQVYLSMRLAVIDQLFPQGGMPLLLDDCFLAYDDERLSQTLVWLAENYSGQVLIFTCQKREAALLRKEQIPFTMISL